MGAALVGLPIWDVPARHEFLACPPSLLSADLRLRGWDINRERIAFPPQDWDSAVAAIRCERQIITSARDAATTPELFDKLVDAAETVHELDGLDAGVAGLVLALNAAGFATESSCRGHTVRPRYDHPYVVAAGDTRRIALLRLLSGHTGVFGAKDAPLGTCLYASTVAPLMALAEAIVEASDEFDALPETIPWDDELYEEIADDF